MNKINIYFGHALTNAPDHFRKSMFGLKDSVSTIPGVSILEYAWSEGDGPLVEVNTFRHDMDHIIHAHLVVVVADFPSDGLGMEILARAMLRRPMVCFIHEEARLSKIVPDCLEEYRKDCSAEVLPEPILYRSVGEIRCYIDYWVQEFREIQKQQAQQQIKFEFVQP